MQPLKERLKEILLRDQLIAPEVIAAVPVDVCRKYCLMPIDKIGRSLTVAMANPLNNQAIEDVERLTSCAVQVFVSTTMDIKNSIKRYYESA